ncbi:hypothetical protein JAAARDRAFT_662528 [Jaapia argillacea MUCL 33604]|uniref:Uncharacterized protein n=1 Tax=Jaapia argillacea MUCL 33604 TaxID=933084 RepID=A0A067PFF4_9AGAM|nr:hypothetical protein JAAARDRAFT_662528 [Jaapia argillacea MUCL 33604]
MLRFWPVKRNPVKRPTPIISGLDRCPPEICEYIFSFACTDDGTTARSLSLVSRYIYQTSTIYRYQTISVMGVDKMLSLCVALEKTPLPRRPVRHLFATHHKIPANASSRPLSRRFTVDLIYGKSSLTQMATSIKDKHEEPTNLQTFRAVVRLLGLVSSTLETLTIVMPSKTQGFAIPLPLHRLTALTELSIYGMFGSHTAWIPELSYTLPKLQRLHIAGPDTNQYQTPWLVRLAPALTHLRLTGVEGGRGVHIPSILEDILALPHSPHNYFPSKPYPRHPAIERIIVQYRIPPLRLQSDFEHSLFLGSLVVLQSIINEYAHDDVVALKPQLWHDDTRRQVMEAKELWVSRVQGGLGCWDEGDQMDLHI